MPGCGLVVVNGYSATTGSARVSAASNCDLPQLGGPSRTTCAAPSGSTLMTWPCLWVRVSSSWRSRAMRRLSSACIFSVPLCLGMVASISSRASRRSSGLCAALNLVSAARYCGVRFAGMRLDCRLPSCRATRPRPWPRRSDPAHAGRGGGPGVWPTWPWRWARRSLLLALVAVAVPAACALAPDLIRPTTLARPRDRALARGGPGGGVVAARRGHGRPPVGGRRALPAPPADRAVAVRPDLRGARRDPARGAARGGRGAGGVGRAPGRRRPGSTSPRGTGPDRGSPASRGPPRRCRGSPSWAAPGSSRWPAPAPSGSSSRRPSPAPCSAGRWASGWSRTRRTVR